MILPNVINLTKAADLPKGSRAIFDTNIFIYFITAHRDFGPSCKAIIRKMDATWARKYRANSKPV